MNAVNVLLLRVSVAVQRGSAAYSAGSVPLAHDRTNYFTSDFVYIVLSYYITFIRNKRI